MLYIMNSAVMPAGSYGTYIYEATTILTLHQAVKGELGPYKSCIGYQQNIELIKKWTGVELTLNRETVAFQHGDAALVMRLKHRIADPTTKGEDVTEDPHSWEWALVSFTNEEQALDQEIQQLAAQRGENEDKDPLTAMAEEIIRESHTRKFTIRNFEKETILEAHKNGPWTVDTQGKFEIFKKWCEIAGCEFRISDNVLKLRHDYIIYIDDMGDCVLGEAPYRSFAIWTRKSRLYIGFRDEDLATRFRDTDLRFNLETTGNRNLKLVVVENGDNSKTIAAALDALDSARNE